MAKSKQTWTERRFFNSSRGAERIRRRSYWTVFFVVPIITAMHVYTSYENHNGQGWKYLLVGITIPAIAQRQGATVVYPSDPGMVALFGRLGRVIEVEDASEFDSLGVVTATFATHSQRFTSVSRTGGPRKPDFNGETGWSPWHEDNLVCSPD